MSATGHARHHARALLSLTVSLTVGLGAGLLAPAHADLAAPSGLAVAHKDSSTPILSWSPVRASTEYEVQVDNDPSFGSPEYAVTTANTRAVPTTNLNPGTNHWRVRAKAGRGSASDWRRGEFPVGAVDVPVPTSPAPDAHLPQPSAPPLLRWTASRGATGYVVELDGDADFIGSKSYATQTTSLVVPDPLSAGDYFWRVRAAKGKSLTSAPSGSSRFLVGELPAPVITYPRDDVNVSVNDVVLDWQPVPGARAYDIEVARDGGFNNRAHYATNIRGTRYSPATTLENDQFWWRVRAVDAAGQTSAWRETRYSFRRSWLEQPVPVHPLGAAAPERQFYEWTPVPHASYYELLVSPDVNFSNGDKCTVVGTTYAPRHRNDCGFPTAGQTYYWKVRARDLPYGDGGLPGVFSRTQSFTWTPPATGTWSGDWAPVTGQKVSMTGTGAHDPAKGCEETLCSEVGATPVLSWDAQPGVTSYLVYFAQDPQFTTTELQPINTTSTMLTVHRGDEDVDALPDSQVGLPYLWYVRPCVGSVCGPDPVSQVEPLPGTYSFSKTSPAVEGLSSSDPAGTDIAFSWDDYLTTNLRHLFANEAGHQSAHTYRIQVDSEPSFSRPLVDEAVVDQATYTAYDKLYPEGRLFWRVQAIDAEENDLTWSATSELVKSSPPVTLSSPLQSGAVAGTTPFEWQAESWANQYTLEVYRNDDHTFSAGNRLFTVTTRSASYAWDKPIPASSAAYTWRVRRIDASGNPGPWSSTGRFFSLGNVPELLRPANGTLVKPANALFEWSDIPRAASYRVSLRSSTAKSQTISTVATAYAPTSLATGDYTWTVEGIDSDGSSLGTSASGTFRVDATAPTVLKITPSKLKPKSKIRVLFSEQVRGLSTRTVVLKIEKTVKKKGKTRTKLVKVKTKVKVLKGSRSVLVQPKKKLKPGTYVLLLDVDRITDLAGNPLVAKTSKLKR